LNAVSLLYVAESKALLVRKIRLFEMLVKSLFP